METYGYEMEELIPVVAALAEKYTGHEHSSVTYEKAQMLMGAVLYCVGEYENSLVQDGREEKEQETSKEKSSGEETERIYEVSFRDKKISAEEACRRGQELVLEKVKKLRELYNGMISDFQDYGLVCLGDTFRQGIPSFFLNYDVRFSPQETLLTLDYPVLKNLRGLSGVNAVWEYVRCIAVEQRFLGKFPASLVRKMLRAYHEEYEELIENLCSIVLEEIFRGMMREEECAGIMRDNIVVSDKQQICAQLLKKMLKENLGCDTQIMDYLEPAVSDTVVRGYGD